MWFGMKVVASAKIHARVKKVCSLAKKPSPFTNKPSKTK
jgi:hypothetical protein